MGERIVIKVTFLYILFAKITSVARSIEAGLRPWWINFRGKFVFARPDILKWYTGRQVKWRATISSSWMGACLQYSEFARKIYSLLLLVIKFTWRLASWLPWERRIVFWSTTGCIVGGLVLQNIGLLGFVLRADVGENAVISIYLPACGGRWTSWHWPGSMCYLR